jgi:hypothetical protein
MEARMNDVAVSMSREHIEETETIFVEKRKQKKQNTGRKKFQTYSWVIRTAMPSRKP